MLTVLFYGAAVFQQITLLLLAAGELFFLDNLRRQFRLGRKETAAADPPVWPAVSIVIPARDEARDLEAALVTQLAQDYPDFEVIVINDRSTDATGEILARLEAQSTRLHVIDGAEPPPGWYGKPHALMQGANAARGKWLLFADADVHYHPAFLREALAYLHAETADFMVVLPRWEKQGFWEQVMLPNLEVASMTFPARLVHNPRWRNIGIGAGAGMLIRRALYDKLGGHAALHNCVVDDIRLGIAAKQAGGRCRMVRAETRVSVRMYQGLGEIVNGFTKNASFVAGESVGRALAMTLMIVLMNLAVLGPPLLRLVNPAVPPRLWVTALVILALAMVLRLQVAVTLQTPWRWALTHPLMYLGWNAITLRSLWFRLRHRRVSWRGRVYDAADSRF